MIVNKATGQARPATGLDGQPIATPTGNLTGEQSNAVAFGARALDAQNTLRQLEAGGTNSGGRFAQGLENLPWVGGALSNGVRSTATLPLGIGAAAQATIAPNEQQQSYEQAQRNFVSAVLRKESGAAISNDEYANEAKKYFPQPGDTPATIEQKARARDLAIEGLKAQAGPGSSLIGGIISNANQDYSNQPRPQTQQSSQPAQPSQSQATLSGLSDEQRMALAQQRAARDPAFAARLRALGH
ncbi:hypothetical protein [Caballeronia sp. LZ001]|uniref:hypothetical protein n=1 Tax=Caballeronia sp. LZ001 TaxID=3038553 RepID=UPI0028586153|nr:hypothetical protein [Caballeronia sp. LZ001]MDR5802128.1 hypothetical protein [Caballeronia sp. LZ001]